jgi:hypothetical protein
MTIVNGVTTRFSARPREGGDAVAGFPPSPESRSSSGVNVIPARREAASPESITPSGSGQNSGNVLEDLWVWIPGSGLRPAPE